MTKQVIAALFDEINGWLNVIDEDGLEHLRPEKPIHLRISAEEKIVEYIAVDGNCYEYYDSKKGTGIVPCDEEYAE